MRPLALASAVVLLAGCPRPPAGPPPSDAATPAPSASASHAPVLDFGVAGLIQGTRTFPLLYGGAAYTPAGLRIILSSAPFDCKLGRPDFAGTPPPTASANLQMSLRLGPGGTFFPGETIAMPYWAVASGPKTDAGDRKLTGTFAPGTLTLEPFDITTAPRIRGTVHSRPPEGGSWEAGNFIRVTDGTFDVAVCPDRVFPTVKPEAAAAACATPDLRATAPGKPDVVIATAISHARADDKTFGDIDLFDYPITCADIAAHTFAKRAVGSILAPQEAQHLLGTPQPADVSVEGMQTERAGWVQVDQVDVPGGTAKGCAYGLDNAGRKLSGHFTLTVCGRSTKAAR